MSEIDDLRAEYAPVAVELPDREALEYVNRDCASVYDRIDSNLDIIRSMDGREVIGFRLYNWPHILAAHRPTSIDDLREALEPFTAYADELEQRGWSDGQPVTATVIRANKPRLTVTVGDFRRARDAYNKLAAPRPSHDKGEGVAKCGCHWWTGECQAPLGCQLMSSDSASVARDQRLADAEADVLRLHNEKMQFFDRAVAAEAAAARASAEVFEEAAKIAESWATTEQIVRALRARAQGAGNV